MHHTNRWTQTTNYPASDQTCGLLLSDRHSLTSQMNRIKTANPPRRFRSACVEKNLTAVIWVRYARYVNSLYQKIYRARSLIEVFLFNATPPSRKDSRFFLRTVASLR